MEPRDLKRFLQKELNVKQLHEGAGGWLRSCCPTHSETRPSWGIFADAEHHPTKCFVCGVSNIFMITMRVLECEAAEAKKLLGKYGYTGTGLTMKQLQNLSFPLYENRILTEESRTYPEFLIAPYEGKHLKYAERRFPHEKDYLKQLRLGVDTVNCRVVIPWFMDGKMIGVTGRHVKRDPTPEPKTLPYFGFHKGQAVYLPSGKIDGSRPFILLEGEGDAMNVNRVYDNCGAVGTATITQKQKNLLLLHGVSDIIVIRDPDRAGEQFANTARRLFEPAYCKVHVVRHPTKDAGAMLRCEIKKKVKELVWPSSS